MSYNLTEVYSAGFSKNPPALYQNLQMRKLEGSGTLLHESSSEDHNRARQASFCQCRIPPTEESMVSYDAGHHCCPALRRMRCKHYAFVTCNCKLRCMTVQNPFSCRPSLLMEALSAQLQHGQQPRALTRSIQLLQVCSQEPVLLDACAYSGERQHIVRDSTSTLCSGFRVQAKPCSHL